MYGAPAKGMAITGGVMSIVMGSLMVIGGIFLFVMGADGGGRMGDMALLMGIITTVIGIPAIILGAFACKASPGATLAAAIVWTILCVLGLVGMVAAFTPMSLISMLLYGTTTAFLWTGWPQAKRYQQWKQSGGGQQAHPFAQAQAAPAYQAPPAAY